MVNMVAGWVNRYQQAIIEYLTEKRWVLIDQERDARSSERMGGMLKYYSSQAA